MKKDSSAPPPRKKSSWKRSFLLLVLLGVFLWLVHPPLVAWALRFGLERWADYSGYKLEIGPIQADLSHPLVLERLRLRAKNGDSRTAADIDRLEASPNWPWHAFLEPKRVFRSATVTGIHAIFDLRNGRQHPPRNLTGLLRWLPQSFAIGHASLEFFKANQSYYLDDVSASFSEESVGKFTAAGAEIQCGPIQQSLGRLEAVTAWKEGAIYFAQLPLQDGVQIESLDIELCGPEGLAFGVDADIFGGSLRGDFSIVAEKGNAVPDFVVSMQKVQLQPLAGLFGIHEPIAGVLREGRFTFRGDLSQFRDGEASLRLAADGFRLHDRGWESLECGASMVHRRLTVSDFQLKQKGNLVSANGEIALGKGFAEYRKSPFSLGLSASIEDLGALAGLLGSPFDQMTGRMSLSGSLNGQGDTWNGFLSLEGSSMGYKKHPINSGRVEVIFANREAQVALCEFWSGKDFLSGQGSVETHPPFTYSGQIRGHIADLSSYFALLQAPGVPSVYSGEVQLGWQGDGTLATHSGAFDIGLTNFVAEHTPEGLTGHFVGTYSPQNFYFSTLELARSSQRFSSKLTVSDSGLGVQDAVLRDGSRNLAKGTVFVPVDVYSWLGGRSFAASLLPGKDLYASLSTDEPVRLKDLARLAGRSSPWDAMLKLNLQASGRAAVPVSKGHLEVRDLKGPAGALLSQAAVDFHSADGRAGLEAKWKSGNFPEASLQAEAPFGLAKTADGSLTWSKSSEPIMGHFSAEKCSLAVLQPLLPGLKSLGGTASGDLAVAGTAAQPVLGGTVSLAGGQAEFPSPWPAVRELEGALSFAGNGGRLDAMTGKLGEGVFDLMGRFRLGLPEGFQCDFMLSGANLQLAAGEGFSWTGDALLKTEGKRGDGEIGGLVRLKGGTLDRHLQVTPELGPDAGGAVSLRQAAAFPIPAALKGWKLDLALKTEAPVALAGMTSGQVGVDLSLGGTLGEPVADGRVEFRDLRLFLPFTTMLASGRLDFAPGVPAQIDARGEARALDYDVQAYASGPLNERRLTLNSDPALSPEALVGLLSSAMAPGVGSPTGLAVARAVGAAVPTFSEDWIPALPAQPEPSTVKGRTRLWQLLSPMDNGEAPGSRKVGYKVEVK